MRQLIFFAVAVLSVVIGASNISAATAEEDASAKTTQALDNSWYGQEFALDGQDVVSFFSESGPMSGNESITVDWENTVWKFTSEENRDAFLEDPERYVPEFGGYCPVALASGDVKIGSAKHFTVIDDKLYLNYDREAEDKFATQPEGYIAAAKLNF